MTTSALSLRSGSGTVPAPSASSAARSGRVRSSIDVAASLFGLSRRDVTAALDSGASLDDIAQRSGVSSPVLRQALVDNMPAALARSGDPAEIAARIASSTRTVNGASAGRTGSADGTAAAASDANGGHVDVLA